MATDIFIQHSHHKKISTVLLIDNKTIIARDSMARNDLL